MAGMPRRLAWLGGCAVAAVLLGFAAALGLWFLPFVAGLAAGASRWRLRSALRWVLAAVAAGWGGALWWPALGLPGLGWQASAAAPVGATARAVAALAGLPAYAGVGVAGPLLVGILECLAGLWLARAVTRLAGRPADQRY
jgi:hypothetical protein